MRYLLISISYKNTDIVVRERLAFDSARQLRILSALKDGGAASESAILVTCNRAELIVCADDLRLALSRGLDVLSAESGVDRVELEGRAHSYEDEGAARHLFSVASGLESMVVGESQIAGQFKDAFKFALEHGCAGKRLRAILDHAARCAAAVRTSTEVGKNPVSVSSAAVTQARILCGGSLEGKTAIVVGSGEMSRLAALHLLGDRANVIVVGRDLEKTQAFASELGGGAEAAPFSRLPPLINSYPLLFSATGAPHTIITAEMVEPRDFERYWFDIAVPRDIAEIEDSKISIFSVDDLREVVKTNMSLREEEAGKAYRIVGEYVENFFGWLTSQGAEGVIKQLRKRAEQAANEEIDRALKKGFIAKEFEENARLLVHNSFKKFLHAPTLELRLAAGKQNGEEVMDCVKTIFDLGGGL